MLELFEELETCRPASFGGVRRIPSLAIYELLERLDVPRDEWQDLVWLVRRLDREFLATLRTETATDPPPPGAPES